MENGVVSMDEVLLRLPPAIFRENLILDFAGEKKAFKMIKYETESEFIKRDLNIDSFFLNRVSLELLWSLSQN